MVIKRNQCVSLDYREAGISVRFTPAKIAEGIETGQRDTPVCIVIKNHDAHAQDIPVKRNNTGSEIRIAIKTVFKIIINQGNGILGVQ